MISYPNAKINIGLHVTNRRTDGFHDIDTLMVPVPFCDIVELMPATGDTTVFSSSGLTIEGPVDANLCLKAFYALSARYDLPPVHIHLHKRIPMGSGLGGGSSDAAFVLKMLNDMHQLDLRDDQLEEVAAAIGSDCPFFIRNRPAIATGRGDLLQMSSIALAGFHIRIVMPEFRISTAEAYRWVQPDPSRPGVEDLTAQSIESWSTHLTNDFEDSVLARFPEGRKILAMLYESGALYAQMSGSGSAFYGLYSDRPGISEVMSSMIVFEGSL